MHSDEFKADAVAACLQPGVSMAAVAMSRGVNANLLRRWVRLAELQCDQVAGEHGTAMRTPTPTSTPAFMPLQLPAPTASSDIRIELRRGATTVAVTWPVDAATQCAAWMRELLR
ncbi:MAG: transposase [Steroidobacteraceae bacterium]